MPPSSDSSYQLLLPMGQVFWECLALGDLVE